MHGRGRGSIPLASTSFLGHFGHSESLLFVRVATRSTLLRREETSIGPTGRTVQVLTSRIPLALALVAGLARRCAVGRRRAGDRGPVHRCAEVRVVRGADRPREDQGPHARRPDPARVRQRDQGVLGEAGRAGARPGAQRSGGRLRRAGPGHDAQPDRQRRDLGARPHRPAQPAAQRHVHLQRRRARASRRTSSTPASASRTRSSAAGRASGFDAVDGGPRRRLQRARHARRAAPSAARRTASPSR